MKNFNLLAGLGGAIVITLLNESLKRVHKNTPRLDLLGKEAVQKSSEFVGFPIKNEESLYTTSIMADLVTNTLYYGMISGEGKKLWGNAASAGILAGIGGITIPQKIGLDDRPVTKSLSTKVLTVTYYAIGAFATAGIIHFFQKNQTHSDFT